MKKELIVMALLLLFGFSSGAFAQYTDAEVDSILRQMAEDQDPLDQDSNQGRLVVRFCLCQYSCGVQQFVYCKGCSENTCKKRCSQRHAKLINLFWVWESN